MIKPLSVVYCSIMFHVAGAQIIRHTISISLYGQWNKKGKGDWVDWIPFFGCYDYQNTCSANIHIVSQNPGLENRNPINETNLILQALKKEIMWNKSYPPSLGPNYEGIKISITIKLTKADIEAKSSTDIAKSQNPIV